jgi:hypothetical protein
VETHPPKPQTRTRSYPPAFRPVFYTHFTKGGEEQDERPQEAFAKRASLSKWFASREVHHESVPDSHPGVRPPSEIRTHRHGQRRPASALGQHGQHQRLNHLRSEALWVFPSTGTHLRTAARPVGTTDPSLRIRPSTRGPCRSSMRQPLLRH